MFGKKKSNFGSDVCSALWLHFCEYFMDTLPVWTVFIILVAEFTPRDISNLQRLKKTFCCLSFFRSADMS